MAIAYKVKVDSHRRMSRSVDNLHIKQASVDSKIRDLAKYLEITAKAMSGFARQQELNSKAVSALRKDISDLILQQQDLTSAVSKLVESTKHAVALMKLSATNPDNLRVEYQR